MVVLPHLLKLIHKKQEQRESVLLEADSNLAATGAGQIGCKNSVLSKYHLLKVSQGLEADGWVSTRLKIESRSNLPATGQQTMQTIGANRLGVAVHEHFPLARGGYEAGWTVDGVTVRGFFSLARMVVLVGLLVALLAGSGCGRRQAETKQPVASQPPHLTVAVLDDNRLAETLRSYEGQWQAETGIRLEVLALSVQGQGLEKADVLIFRSAQLGQLAEPGWLLPLGEEKLRRHTSAWNDLVEMLRDHEGRWGEQIYAVPLGSPVLVCYCRVDLLDRLGLLPPRTWEEYIQIAEQLGDRNRLADAGLPKNQPWAPALEPLAAGWAGWTLLARAASYTKHPNYYSTLFEMESMRPRIAEPPFVRALQELVATATLSGPEFWEMDPDQVRERFWRGECGLTLCWPSRAGPEKAAPEIKCTVVPIPGASALWHPGERKWLPAPKGEPFRTPLLGISGRWAALHAQCQHPEAALELIFWLVGKQGTEPRPAVCPATAVFRKSDLKDPQRLQAWVELAMPRQTVQQYAEALQATLSSSQWLVALRIPGWQEYMAALDEAVRAAVRGQRSPQQALQEAAENWQQITRRLGLERQRQAYRRNLGLPD